MTRSFARSALAAIGGASIALVAFASAADARPLPRDNSLRACVKSAVAQKRVKTTRADIRYTCAGQAAQNWYASLEGGRMVDDGPRGYFHSRYHNWDGYCAKHLTDADGRSNEYFICEVELPRR